jgi:hypothetical protein
VHRGRSHVKNERSVQCIETDNEGLNHTNPDFEKNNDPKRILSAQIPRKALLKDISNTSIFFLLSHISYDVIKELSEGLTVLDCMNGRRLKEQILTNLSFV